MISRCSASVIDERSTRWTLVLSDVEFRWKLWSGDTAQHSCLRSGDQRKEETEEERKKEKNGSQQF